MERIELKTDELFKNMDKIAYTLDKAYLHELSSGKYYPWLFERYSKDKENDCDFISYENNIRSIKVNKWVIDRNEDPDVCFKNVLSVFADGEHTIALVLTRRQNSVEMYFVVKNEGAGMSEVSGTNEELLEATIKGNFPGSDIETYTNYKDMLIDPDSISCLICNPSEYKEESISQGLEKVINGMVPNCKDEEYSIIFLCESITQVDIRDILTSYENMATSLFPYSSYQYQYGKGSNKSKSEMKTITDSTGINESIFHSHSINIGVNGSVSESRSKNKGTIAKAITKGLSGAAAGAVSGGLAGAAVGGVGAVPGAIGGGVAVLIKGVVTGATSGVTKTKSSTAGLSGGYGYSSGESRGKNSSRAKGKSDTLTFGESESEGNTYTYKSYTVSNLIDRIERTIEQINESQSCGLWKVSTYVLTKGSTATARSKSIANFVRAIIQGKKIFDEPYAIQEWQKNSQIDDYDSFGEIKEFVTHFTHPIFYVDGKNIEDFMMVTPTTYVSTENVSKVIPFPQSALPGLPIVNCVSFGREPHYTDSEDSKKLNLRIGYSYHMQKPYEKHEIKIAKSELTKHVFVTGSTGAGKSTAIYILLNQLKADQHFNFLVVEPAKGDYKRDLKEWGIKVYGTNPKNAEGTELLCINPFQFPDSVHVLEHIDRLIEIFNACWPMYAAMPQVLKEAVERAYEKAGWDLLHSENVTKRLIYPDFHDVLREIKLVMNESDYSDDNKGDYTGALVTRLKSLTNGLVGQIFVNHNVEDAVLFDSRCIVDLSRVGAVETKALLMGMIVMKLQEHRMDQHTNEPKDETLKHITVLEEAHNLLRKSNSHSVEGANVVGKSVEMITNAIAEMRTYGEGFVIVDQAPDLLDPAAIRNTNTKILFRLPDAIDRDIVGKSIGLNEDQITELGTLKQRVAVVSQSDWIQPVLVHIDPFEIITNPNSEDEKSSVGYNYEGENMDNEILDFIFQKDITLKLNDKKEFIDKVARSALESQIKVKLIQYIQAIENKDDELNKLRSLVYEFLHADIAIDKAKTCGDNIEQWAEKVLKNLNPSIEGQYSRDDINLALALIVYEKRLRDPEYTNVFHLFSDAYFRKGYVI